MCGALQSHLRVRHKATSRARGHFIQPTNAKLRTLGPNPNNQRYIFNQQPQRWEEWSIIKSGKSNSGSHDCKMKMYFYVISKIWLGYILPQDILPQKTKYPKDILPQDILNLVGLKPKITLINPLNIAAI